MKINEQDGDEPVILSAAKNPRVPTRDSERSEE